MTLTRDRRRVGVVRSALSVVCRRRGARCRGEVSVPGLTTRGPCRETGSLAQGSPRMRIHPSLTLTALLAVLAPASLVAAANLSVPVSVTAAVADSTRPKSDVDTDVNRKPAETLTFAGVKPGMNVGEFFPGGGYYTRLLSDVVGPKGHVYGIENAGWQGAVKADDAVLAEGTVRERLDRTSAIRDGALLSAARPCLGYAELPRLEGPRVRASGHTRLRPRGLRRAEAGWRLLRAGPPRRPPVRTRRGSPSSIVSRSRRWSARSLQRVSDWSPRATSFAARKTTTASRSLIRAFKAIRISSR